MYNTKLIRERLSWTVRVFLWAVCAGLNMWFAVDVFFYLEHVQIGMVQVLLRTRGCSGTGGLVVWQDDDVWRWSSSIVIRLTECEHEEKQKNVSSEHARSFVYLQWGQVQWTSQSFQTQITCQDEFWRTVSIKKQTNRSLLSRHIITAMNTLKAFRLLQLCLYKLWIVSTIVAGRSSQTQ